MSDYYEILGVEKNATKDEIKSAFRKMARQWHPDVNKAPEAEAKFKELGKAYETLMDDDKRATYDRYGEDGLKNAGFNTQGPFAGGFGDLEEVFNKIRTIAGNENVNALDTGLGSVVYAVKPGDGSAREQAASCQRVLGGIANIAKEYATKRYRSNLMNWGMIPFLLDEAPVFEVDDYIYVPNIKNILDGDITKIPAYVIGKEVKEFNLHIADMTPDERKIVKAGCLINFNRNKMK